MTDLPQQTWRLDGHIARFQVPQLQATVDVLRPAAGLQISFSQWRETPEWSLLRVSLPDREQDNATAGVDFFVRGGDLVATYEETPEHPLRAQIYWRALPIAELATPAVEVPVAAFELIVSVQTHLLDKDPALSVESRLPKAAVRHLIDADAAHFETPQAADGDIAITPNGGAGCLVARISELSLVYAEMVHPADFYRIVAEWGDYATEPSWTNHLFPQRLEKGVILRSRLRGLFFPAETSPSAIAAAYREFAASPPPLTV